MAEVLHNLRKRAEELIASINSAGGLKATIEGLRRQMAEADRRRAMAQVRAELKRLENEITEMNTAIGIQAVGLHKEGRLQVPELAPLCQHIIELEATLSQQREQLRQLEALAEISDSTGERRCSQCQHILPDGATFCPYCGTPAPASSPKSPVRFCTHCGAKLRPESRFCSQCGEAVPRP